MARRYAKWFQITPLGTSFGAARGKYLGGDSIGEGTVGRTYDVYMYSASKLEAPNPPFSTEEGFVRPRKSLKHAMEDYVKKMNK